MYAIGDDIRSTCDIRSNVGFNCSELAKHRNNHTPKTASLNTIVVQRGLTSNSSARSSANFSFLEYLSTEGLFGTDKNHIHCTLCHRTVEIVEMDSEGKIAYSRNGFHKSICHNATEYVCNHGRYKEYQTFEARIETFSEWPIDKEQTPISLAVAGFWFLGLEDQVKCFSCGGILFRWDKNDKPDEEHALSFPKCGFIKHIKGSSFVNDIQLKKAYSILPIAPISLSTPPPSPPPRSSLSSSPQSSQLSPFSSLLSSELLPLPPPLLPLPLPPLPSLTLKDRIELSSLEDSYKRQQPVYPRYAPSVERERSFTEDCPDYFKNNFLDKMVEAGFFFFEPEEYVRCFSCGFGKKKWLNDEYPILIHFNLRKGCDYINSPEGKIIIEKNMQAQRRFVEILDDTSHYSSIISTVPDESEEVSMNLLDGATINKMAAPVYPLYSNFCWRLSLLETFNHLWHVPKSKLNEMAKAGFFYISDDDYKRGIFCFHCGNRFDGWTFSDDMAKEHTYLYPKCGWIKYRNSDRYVVTEKDVEKKKVRFKSKLIYSMFRHFSDRKNTFISQWPHSAPSLSPEKMAEAGFFFFSVSDNVRCFECALQVCSWNDNHNPILQHFKINYKCHFINSKKLEKLLGNAFYLKPSGIEDQEDQEDQEARLIASGNAEEISIVLTSHEEPDTDVGSPACYPAFAFFSARKESFLNSIGPWPHASVEGQDAESMAKAGFFLDYYKRKDKDITYCFQCGFGVFKWLRADDPFDGHDKHVEGCRYLRRTCLVSQERVELGSNLNKIVCGRASHISHSPEDSEHEIMAASLNWGASEPRIDPSFSTYNQESMGDRERWPVSTRQEFVMPSVESILRSEAAQVMLTTGQYSKSAVLEALKFIIQSQQNDNVKTSDLAEYLYFSHQ